MASKFYIKSGDTLPSLEATLVGADRITPIDLSAALSIRFHMFGISPKPTVIVNAVLGQVRVDWSEGDTEVVGRHKAEFQVNWNSGKVQTVPNDGYFEVEIKRDLN